MEPDSGLNYADVYFSDPSPRTRLEQKTLCVGGGGGALGGGGGGGYGPFGLFVFLFLVVFCSF